MPVLRYHNVKETIAAIAVHDFCSETNPMAFVVRPTPVIIVIGSQHKFRELPLPKLFGLVILKSMRSEHFIWELKMKVHGSFSELVKGLVKAQPVKFNA